VLHLLRGDAVTFICTRGGKEPAAEDLAAIEAFARFLEAQTGGPMRHTCHAHCCDVAVPPKLLMCKRHWYMVPKDLRDAVWLTYRPGQEIDKSPTMEYLETAHEAINAVAVKEGHEPPFRVAAL
jgi:hypothetical protein